jgi:hypothetical protein
MHNSEFRSHVKFRARVSSDHFARISLTRPKIIAGQQMTWVARVVKVYLLGLYLGLFDDEDIGQQLQCYELSAKHCAACGSELYRRVFGAAPAQLKTHQSSLMD